MRTTGRARRGTRATTACRWVQRVVPRDAGHRGQRVLSRLSGRERGTFASRLVQFAITRAAVPRRANGGGRSLGCRPIWASAAVKLGGRPFGELGPALAWRDDLRENGGALDGVRALPAKGKNFSFRGCTRRPMGHPPGPTNRWWDWRGGCGRRGP